MRRVAGVLYGRRRLCDDHIRKGWDKINFMKLNQI